MPDAMAAPTRDSRDGHDGRDCYYEVVVEARYRPPHADPRAAALLAMAHRHGASGLAAIEARRLFHVTVPASPATRATPRPVSDDAIAGFLALLHDPLLHDVETARDPRMALADTAAAWAVDVSHRPGVLDPEGDGVSAWWAGLHPDGPRPLLRAGHRYLLHGDLSDAGARRLAGTVLANPLIHVTTVYALRRDQAGCLTMVPLAGAADDAPSLHTVSEEGGGDGRAAPWPNGAGVERVPLAGLDDAALAALSRHRLLALGDAEMRAIQAYFEAAGRAPTDVELETFALTWSEHCCHKTFRAPIDYTEVDAGGRERRRRINGLLRSTIIRATRRLDRPWVRSAFVDNAGIVAFDERHDIAIKVETHNHPSAIEPFGGANTGVGGVIRDVLAVSARPIAATDVLCFGHPASAPADLPAGTLAPDRVAGGVIAGVADYGNKMGVPVVAGATLFDDGYAANPLVFCGCVGLAPVDRPSDPPRPDDLVVAIGGRTGRDGVHGATFSSGDLDAAAAATLGSVVQIGEPIVEKRVADALERLRTRGLYRAMTDCGAGGFCSAVGELGAATGVTVDLAAAPLKYPGLRPWEIWLSESQERMVLAVPPGDWPAAHTILSEEGVEGTVLGRFLDDGRLRVSHGNAVVVDLPMATLHEGRPRATLTARWQAPPRPLPKASVGQEQRAGPAGPADLGRMLTRLLAHPTIASKVELIRRYDHEVQGGTVRGPLDGPGDGPADAAVLAPVPDSWRGLAIACGLNPWYGRLDPYGAALLAVEEALRNTVAAGGDPRRAALLDNFAWGNPTHPDTLGALVRAAQGCHDASIGLGAPFVSGKDSLYNEYRDPGGVAHAIPGTLLITAVAIVPDVRRTPGTSLSHPGDLLYVVGTTGADLGGSHLALLGEVTQGDDAGDDRLPALDLVRSRRTLRALALAIRRGLVRACHDLSEGGLGVALAEMAIGGGRGLRLDLARIPTDGRRKLPPDVALFAETPSRFAVAVAPRKAAAFERTLAGVPLAQAGMVAEGDHMVVRGTDGRPLLDITLETLGRAWRTPLGTTGREEARAHV